ncbi:MAG: FkbM family methyltransferase [Bacillales bacterium]|jgi:FkbM family methyltransferase|nr:FkbM family methyltransferase [Bacillales bacterium]
MNILKNRTIKVVDVGASGGIDIRWNSIIEHTIPILFEPDPREFNNLKEKLPENYIVFNTALSDIPGLIEFHLCKKQQVSSVYKPNYELISKFPASERFDVLKTIQVQADTLDNKLDSVGISDVDFIKIDTQGYELSILQGARNTLKCVIGIEVEVEFIEIYENQPLFEEVNGYITDLGFEMMDLKRYFWRRNGKVNYGSNKGQLIFGDALYFRTPESVCSLPNIDEDKVVRTAMVYKSYGYFDLIEELINIAKDKRLLTLENYNKLYNLCLEHEDSEFPILGKGRIQSDESIGN